MNECKVICVSCICNSAEMIEMFGSCAVTVGTKYIKEYNGRKKTRKCYKINILSYIRYSMCKGKTFIRESHHFVICFLFRLAHIGAKIRKHENTTFCQRGTWPIHKTYDNRTTLSYPRVVACPFFVVLVVASRSKSTTNPCLCRTFVVLLGAPWSESMTTACFYRIFDFFLGSPRIKNKIRQINLTYLPPRGAKLRHVTNHSSERWS
jgi:hypothetical protein